jgi:hypothetical protein
VINRLTLECDACSTRIITRTAIGLGNTQVLAFPCPVCSVGIIFRMQIDQEAVSFTYETKPDNAHWVDSEEGAKFEATFDVDFLVPRTEVVCEHRPGALRVSPYMQATRRFLDYRQFSTQEGERREWLAERAPIVERLCVHFERQNWDVFTKEIRKLDSGISVENQIERFEAVCLASREYLGLLTFPQHFKLVPRIEQRLALARSISAEVTERVLLRELQRTGRLLEWWTQIRDVRAAYFDAYPYYHPILQPLYWKEKDDVVNKYVVTNKGFSVLKDLYISAFETLARISVIAIGLEAVIHYRKLEIPAKKGRLSTSDFEALSTANKRDRLIQYPIGDVFGDFLDTRVRNGIGHNSARYDAVDDAVIPVKSKAGELKTDKINYTEFCRKVVSMVSRLFVVETYLNAAVRAVGGHLDGGANS